MGTPAIGELSVIRQNVDKNPRWQQRNGPPSRRGVLRAFQKLQNTFTKGAYRLTKRDFSNYI
jgi:hypothetical protein